MQGLLKHKVQGRSLSCLGLKGSINEEGIIIILNLKMRKLRSEVKQLVLGHIANT